MAFIPASDYILVKPIKRRQSHVIEVISNEKYSRGLVVAVGPGERIVKRRRLSQTDWEVTETGAIRPMQVKPGDFITHETIGRYGAYSEGGVDYVILQEKDVAFISERQFIDEHNLLSDEDIDRLIAAHNHTVEILTDQALKVA